MVLAVPAHVQCVLLCAGHPGLHATVRRPLGFYSLARIFEPRPAHPLPVEPLPGVLRVCLLMQHAAHCVGCRFIWFLVTAKHQLNFDRVVVHIFFKPRPAHFLPVEPILGVLRACLLLQHAVHCVGCRLIWFLVTAKH
jgi:hypothetical protein